MVRHKIKLRKDMSYHNNKFLSENEEMYLVTIANLGERGIEEPVPLSTLAKAMSVLPVSVNQMIHRLAESDLVKYMPYKGVEFTTLGRTTVMRLLQFRRLWEVFLVRHLKMSVDDAEALACRMEHITSDDVAERLDDFLEKPTACYHGYPIPRLNNEEVFFAGLSLDRLDVGERAQVLQVEANPTTRAFLANEGIVPGIDIVLLALGGNAAVLLEVSERRVYLSEDIARAIYVEPAVGRTSVRVVERDDQVKTKEIRA